MRCENGTITSIGRELESIPGQYLDSWGLVWESVLEIVVPHAAPPNLIRFSAIEVKLYPDKISRL